MRIEMTLLRVVAMALATMLAGGVTWAQPRPIEIGMTAPLSGPNAAYGLGLQHGARLAMARANAAGGVGGRSLELLVLDDGGDALRAAANARQLLQRGVVALTGAHGASVTAAIAQVIALEGGSGPLVPLVAPGTGADSLREPTRPGVFHLRASTADEARSAVLHLDTIGVARYALLTQADALGDAGRDRVLHELTRIAIRPAANERLAATPSVTDIQRAVTVLCAANPEAVILALDAEHASTALETARKLRCSAHYLVFSETGAALSARPEGASGPHPQAGLLVTQVVPHPNQRSHRIVEEYQRALTAQGTGPGSYPSLEAYLAMRVIQEALGNCERDPGQTCLLKVLSTRALELPGLTVRFGSAHRQPNPYVEITMLDAQGRFRR
jgi:ABC-type branched-subunit amino acid transport system substrate-binding protein